MINETTGILQTCCVGRKKIVTFHRMTTHRTEPAVSIDSENNITINNAATTAYNLSQFNSCELFISSEKTR